MDTKTGSILIWALSFFGFGWILSIIILLTDMKNDSVLKAHAVNNLTWTVLVMIGSIIFVLPGIVMFFIGFIGGLIAAIKGEKPNIWIASKFCEKQGWC